MRRRRRSSFSSSPDGLGRVRWLQPARTRRRRRPPVVPILLLLVVLAGAAGAGWVLLARQAADDRRQEAVDALHRRLGARRLPGDVARDLARAPPRLAAGGVRGQLPDRRGAGDREGGRGADGRRAGRRAGAGARAGPHARLRRAARHGPAARRRARRRDVPGLVAVVAAAGAARGRERPPPRARAARSGARSSPATAAGWTGSRPRPRSPAPRPAGRRARHRACRRSTTSGSAAARAPSCASASGWSSASRSSAGARCARRSRRGCSGPPRRRSATASAAIAVVRPRTGSVLAMAGIAASGPQPPGSTFKIITLSGALQAGIASPSSGYPVQTAATLSGVRLANASNESCGGSLANSFAHSCNSVFAPLGAKLGAKRLVRLAEAYGFNEKPRLPDEQPSTIARDLQATTSRSARPRSGRSATSPPRSRWPPSGRRSPTAACGCARGSCARSAAAAAASSPAGSPARCAT